MQMEMQTVFTKSLERRQEAGSNITWGYIGAGQAATSNWLPPHFLRRLYRNASNGRSGPGCHSPGREEREKESYCGVAAPQRPGRSIRLSSILQATKHCGITPSMSRRGNPYDNAMVENFFSILKTECIYRYKPAAFTEANELLD